MLAVTENIECCIQFECWVKRYVAFGNLFFRMSSFFGFARYCNSAFPFFAPKPTYIIEESFYLLDNATGKRLIEPQTNINICEANFIKSLSGNKIAVMLIRIPGATATMLYSHGNSIDLGGIRNAVWDMGARLKVNVLAYDYSGYGQSSGKASVENTKMDAESVLAWLVSSHSTLARSIILYGQSLGSALAVHLANVQSTLEHGQNIQNDRIPMKNSVAPRIVGVVLHSPFMSALRVLNPEMETTPFFDVYSSIDLMKNIQYPVLVIHGAQDADIPVLHGIALANAAPRGFLHIFAEAGHNDIESSHRAELIACLHEFIRTVDDQRMIPWSSCSAELMQT